MQQSVKLKVLFVSAEVSPFAKTGGLADVAGSLPQALTALGHDVRVAMPRYKKIPAKMDYVTDFALQMGERKETCIVRSTGVLFNDNNVSKSVPIYFIDNHNYYDREGIYCYFDDAERFAFFCKAVLDMLPKINFLPDVIHCNDWHTGPICMLLKEKYINDSFYKDISTVYTIHNLEYQGTFPGDVARLFNIEGNIFTPDKVEFYGMFNFMKAGLVYSDIINAVSEKYAEEILTEQYGEKLEGVLKLRMTDLFGITNGISYEDFNPLTDKRIYKNYYIENIIDKKENKKLLQKDLNLPQTDMPIIGLISRLTGQKGLNLIVDGFDELMKNDVQFVLLGEGDEYYESAFRDFKDKYPDKVSTYIGFNADLAQKIYAGSDFFLMPSRFEPCGLGQIISLRYGTIPIVRATGGLSDTILDYNKNSSEGNGFSFTEFASDELIKTVRRALKLYNSSDEWLLLVKRALKQDFSWKQPAKKYSELYYLSREKSAARS